jgi:hypothetical protein
MVLHVQQSIRSAEGHVAEGVPATEFATRGEGEIEKLIHWLCPAGA